MTATEVLAKVRAAGGAVIVDCDGPRLRVPKALRPLVEEHRAELRRLLETDAGSEPIAASLADRLTAELLEDFRLAGSVHEVRMPGIPETLFMVPTLDHARRLMVWENISRGRIFTAAELADLLAVHSIQRTPETWKAVALAKLALDGEVVEVRAR